MQQPISPSSPRYLYLSYSVFETEFALQLAADLRAAGYRVWCDRLDVNPSAPVYEQVKRAIRASAVLVSVLSPAYLHARYARLEWEFAARKRYAIVPVLAGPVAAADLPLELSLDSRLDFTDWRSESSYSAQLTSLLSALDGRGHSNLCRTETPHPLDSAISRQIARLEMRRAAAETREMPDKLDGIAALALRPTSNLLTVWGKPAMVRLTTGDAADSGRLVPMSEAEALPRLVLTGGPGTGKSATLERLALDAARAFAVAPDQQPFPIWAHLADWDGDVGFGPFLSAAWERAGLAEEPFDTWVQQGRVALYLDGLNELGGWAEAKAGQLRDWFAGAPETLRAVVTCRSRDYTSLLSLGMPVAEVQALDDEAVSRIARAQLGEAEGTRFLTEIASAVGDGERAGAPDLARTPAALNGLLALYRSAPQGKPPTTLGGLFKRVLPSAWLCKRIEQMPGWLPFMPVEAALAQIAQYFLIEDIPLSAPAEVFAQDADREAALRAARNAGLIEVRDGRLRFRSRLLLEYFAAVGTSRQDLLGYLRGARFDAHAQRAGGSWDVVVAFMAGMTPNPDSLVRDVAEIDPYLAAECLANGVRVSDPVYDTLITNLLQIARTSGASGQAAARALNVAARQSITPTLLDLMRTSSWHGRLAALDVLRASEANVPAALLRALRGWDWAPQDGLIPALRNAGADAVALMLTVLDDPEWQRRRGAAWALGVLEDLAAVPALVQTLSDRDGLVRREAAGALSQLKDPAALPGLLAALGDTELPVRRAAAGAIAGLGETALPSVQSSLANASIEQRVLLAEILGGLGVPEATGALIPLTSDEDASVRAAAVLSLGKLAQPESVPALSISLRDTVQPSNVDEPICYLAATALRAVGTAEALTVVDEWRAGQTPAGIEAVQQRAAPAAESDVLLLQLVSPDWQQRRDAVLGLVQRGDRAYLPLIAEALKDEDSQVRWVAARGLGEFTYDPAATDALIAAFADTESLVADEAANSIVHIGVATVPALIASLKSKNPNVRASAIFALGKLGDRSALPALKKVSKDKTRAPREDQAVGALALVAIAQLSAAPVEVAPAAVGAAGTGKSEPSATPAPVPPDAPPIKKLPVIPGPVEKGGELPVEPAEEPVDIPPVSDTPPPEVVVAPPVEKPVAEPEPAAPSGGDETPVAPAHQPSGPPVPDVALTPVTEDTTWDDLPALLAALSDPEWEARDKAAKSLRLQARNLRGIDDPEAVGLLAEALRDDDYTVRWAVVGALAWLRDDATIPMLLEAMHDRHFTVRLAVIRAFEEIASVSVAPALAERLRDPHPLVREKAAEALGKLRANEAEESLLAALDDGEPFVRRAAAEALGELRLPVQTARLIEALDDEDVYVRMAAAESLGRLGVADAVARLIEHLNDYGGAEWDQQRVCDVAAAALEAIGTTEALAAVEGWRRKLNQLRRGQ